MDKVSELIKIARVKKNMTQKELANKTGYASMYISEIERGIKRPIRNIKVYRSICDVLDIDPPIMIDSILCDLKDDMIRKWQVLF